MADTIEREASEGSRVFRPEAVAAFGQRFGSPANILDVSTWVLVAFFITTFSVVAIFLVSAHYARKETVLGSLEPTAGALRIVAVRPGVVTTILVREGQMVSAGAPIATLSTDPTIEGGSLGAALQGASETQNRALDEEARFHAISIARQLESLNAKRRGLITSIKRLQLDLGLQRERVDLQSASLEAARKLNDQKLYSDLQYRQRQEAVVGARQDLSRIERQIEDAGSALEQLAADRERLLADAQEASAQYRASGSQLAEQRASYAADRQTVLTAPQSGRLIALQAKAGSSVGAGQTLAIVMPRGARLEAQLWARSRAVGFLRPGDQVRLMYDAFPYQRFGVGHGVVTAVANAPTPPNELPVPIETHESLYRVSVSIDRQTIDAYGRSWPLTPGARVSADLILESRSFIEWLLEPLLSIKRRAA